MYSRHRIITELNCDLRPPGAILRHEVDVELQPARRDRALRIFVRGQAITALPARNRRLTAPESLSQFALSQPRSTASHQNPISAIHTTTVSSLVDSPWWTLQTSPPPVPAGLADCPAQLPTSLRCAHRSPSGANVPECGTVRIQTVRPPRDTQRGAVQAGDGGVRRREAALRGASARRGPPRGPRPGRAEMGTSQWRPSPTRSGSSWSGATCARTPIRAGSRPSRTSIAPAFSIS